MPFYIVEHYIAECRRLNRKFSLSEFAEYCAVVTVYMEKGDAA